MTTSPDALAVRRWEVPVDDSWHLIPAGQITAIGVTRNREVVDVWVASHGIRQDTRIVRVYATGQSVDIKRAGFLGTAVVPHHLLAINLLGHQISNPPPLVWHLIEDTARETEN